MKNIYFSGDSFTYGEGLELYTPTDKWKDELYKYNPWPELEKKIDLDSTEFRTKNNFVGIFSENFPDVNVYQSSINGGSVSEIIYNRLPTEIDLLTKVDIIVFQFTTFQRNPLHLNYSCKCDFCKNTNYLPLERVLYSLDDYKKKGPFLFDKILINEFCKQINFYDIDSYDILEKYDEFLNNSIKNQIQIFKKDFLNKFIDSGVQVYFIDSWCKLSSNLLQQDDDIRNLTIPLISTDGEPYPTWGKFISKFDYPTICDKYKKTSNHHPTPYVHRLIANSLIEFFKDKL